MGSNREVGEALVKQNLNSFLIYIIQTQLWYLQDVGLKESKKKIFLINVLKN